MIPIEKSFQKVAHLDLKGMQLGQELLLEWVERLAAFGYTGLLVEYEDRFPYRSPLARRKDEVWSPEFLRSFLDTARRVGLSVIPLQQTLGHLEYALRWDLYAEYRMPVGFPSTLHLGSPKAKAWLKELLVEVIRAHEDSPVIHLGMDEARSLGTYAKANGLDPLELFLTHLEELCEICEAHGKTPMIWSDMLEDHLKPENIERICGFRDRVILVFWEYAASGNPVDVVRFSGRRCSQYWLENPEVPGGPKLSKGSLWTEEWHPSIAKLAERFRAGEAHFKPLFQAAVWKELGFRVWGAGAASASEDGPLIPMYHRRIANLDNWKQAVEEWYLDGLIVTAWQRAQTCSPPGIVPELHSAMFWYGGLDSGEPIPPAMEDARDLLITLGRCRESWWVEERLVKQLEGRAPIAGMSDHEWQVLILMLRIQEARRAIDMAVYQAERYLVGDRLTACEWEARLLDLEVAKKGLERLRCAARGCLDGRYAGEALEEWFELVFDSYVNMVARLAFEIEGKKARATLSFAKQPGSES